MDTLPEPQRWMCGDVTVWTGVVTLPTTRWMWEVVSIWGGAHQETLSYDEQKRIDNAREKALCYIGYNGRK